MKVYLEEYINEDVYKLLKKDFELVKDKSICEAVISRCLIIDKAFMDSAPNLKCIAMYGTGVDAIDLVEAKKRNILVFNAPKQNCLSVAELNVALMLSIARKLEKGFMDAKANGVIDYQGNLGNEISNKTVGFIGIGEISILTAKILKNGFGCNTIGYNRTYKGLNLIEEKSLDTVLKESDFIVLGLALNEETKGIINLDKLKCMKSDAYLINATRGGLVNHDDLVYALRNNIIRGYAADVFEIEPVLTSDPLLKENVTATPHIGGNTVEALYRVGYLLYQELLDYKNGKKPKFTIE